MGRMRCQSYELFANGRIEAKLILWKKVPKQEKFANIKGKNIDSAYEKSKHKITQPSTHLIPSSIL